MRRQSFCFAIFLVVALCCPAALGTTYYVATNGDNGDPGTEAEPWATLQYAVDTVTGGDTIIVKAGTYVGCRIENLSATASAPCVLKAETALSVLLDVPDTARAKHNGILEIENFSGTVDYWEVDGFEVDGNSKTYRCIDVRVTDHITVKNCEVYQAYATGIMSGFSDYMVVENCTSYSNGEHGIYMANSADNGVVRGNTCYSNVGCGIHMNGDESMGGDGQMSYWLVEKNTCYFNPLGSGVNCDGVSDSKIYNNLLYRNQGSGISLYAGDGAEGSSDDLVYNNTIYMPSDGRWCVNIPASSGKPSPTGNKVKNNILMSDHTFRGAITTYSSSVTGFESDYNAVVDRFSIDDGSNNISLSTWQGYGYDLNSFLSTCADLFEDYANDDYHLKTGSPAIDEGTTLSDVTDDIEGSSRPQGSGYDIGCYEASGEIQPLEITTTSLPNGQVGLYYSQTLQATGGVTPYSWSVISGSLPDGLNLTQSTGVISGTPTTEETANFTVQVTDSQDPADTDTQALSITIDPAPDPLVITTTSLPNGVKKQSYSQTLQATGGVTPYTWSKVSGSFPNGLSLNSSTGEISGTCRKTGTWNFTVRCTDDASDYDEQALSITVTN